jgi:Protein of unknown function (DUF1566)
MRCTDALSHEWKDVTMNTIKTLALLAVAWNAQAACPTWPAADRFEQHGDQVIDLRSGLVWQRCSAGQTWDGSTCTGTAGLYTHAQAFGLALQANPSNNPSGWRLPNVKELGSLLDMGCKAPAMDATVFPATPQAKAWSSTPNVRRPNVAWTVDFGPAYIDAGTGIGNPLAVRLVRSAR